MHSVQQPAHVLLHVLLVLACALCEALYVQCLAGSIHYSVHANIIEGCLVHHWKRWRAYKVYLAGVLLLVLPS